MWCHVPRLVLLDIYEEHHVFIFKGGWRHGVGWLIDVRVQDLTVPMHLGPNWWALCAPYQFMGAPVTLLKFQMAPRLILLVSSGSKKKEPRYTCLSEAKAARSQRMWVKVSSSAPHLLHSGLSSSPIRWRCLRVLCPVRRPVTALDYVLLKNRNLALAPRQGPEINSQACLWVLPRPHHERLWWSRGNMLPFAGSNPAEAVRIFQGEKILSAPSFRGEVKPSVPCRRFAACKRSLNETWKSTFRQNYWPTFSPTVPPFAARISHVIWTWRHLAAEVGTSKNHGGTKVAQ